MNNQIIGNVLLGFAAGGLTYMVFVINKTALQTLFSDELPGCTDGLAPAPGAEQMDQTEDEDG